MYDPRMIMDPTGGMMAATSAMVPGLPGGMAPGGGLPGALGGMMNPLMGDKIAAFQSMSPWRQAMFDWRAQRPDIAALMAGGGPEAMMAALQDWRQLRPQQMDFRGQVGAPGMAEAMQPRPAAPVAPVAPQLPSLRPMQPAQGLPSLQPTQPVASGLGAGGGFGRPVSGGREASEPWIRRQF